MSEDFLSASYLVQDKYCDRVVVVESSMYVEKTEDAERLSKAIK